MTKVKKGFTNLNKEIIDDKFIIHKTKTGFNHRLDYTLTNQFDFVPEVLEDTQDKLVSKYIESEWLTKPTNDDLVELAGMMRKIHMSDMKLPKNNLRERIKSYIKIIHDKGMHVPVIEDNWRYMNRTLGKMGRLNPIHNDLWEQNILKATDGKLWIVDWEYATMGDKHFDLAFYIESSKLDEEQVEIFLSAYNSHDDYQAWIPEWMPHYRAFVHWVTLCWAYAQPRMPFDTRWMEVRIKEIMSANKK